jgi:hypothetical protein
MPSMPIEGIEEPVRMRCAEASQICHLLRLQAGHGDVERPLEGRSYAT